MCMTQKALAGRNGKSGSCSFVWEFELDVHETVGW